MTDDEHTVRNIIDSGGVRLSFTIPRRDERLRVKGSAVVSRHSL